MKDWRVNECRGVKQGQGEKKEKGYEMGKKDVKGEVCRGKGIEVKRKLKDERKEDIRTCEKKEKGSKKGEKMVKSLEKKQ